VLATVIRWFFVLLMAASAIGKLADMPGFFAIVASYRLLPAAVIPVSAWALALFELSVAAWLIAGRRMREAALALAALHIVYLAWLLIALARGLSIANCGCFGVYWPRPLTWLTPLEDVFLLTLAVLLWRGVRSIPPIAASAR
jgi:uncharacterized membrane protein YphA (DoxX/SURF4 family)